MNHQLPTFYFLVSGLLSQLFYDFAGNGEDEKSKMLKNVVAEVIDCFKRFDAANQSELLCKYQAILRAMPAPSM